MAEQWNGEERRANPRVILSETQLEQIAERAAEKALENFYFEVGKVTIRAGLYILGAGLLALAAWLGVSEKIRG